MKHNKRPKQPDMSNDFIYQSLRDKPGNFFYGVDQRLSLFIKLYVLLFFVYLAIVVVVLKDLFLPGFSESHFFFFLLFPTGSL